ncbi:MAG: GDP-mannose dehydrogenase [Candidatus Bathyarchaeota archaeon]|nr:GDP-mannose dehydrogenase [Candidatus Bathyarchaeota archaeon]
MTKETVLIVGLGEIGHALFMLYQQKSEDFSVYGLDLDEAKMRQLNQTKTAVPPQIDTLQICLPCANPERFADVVAGYASQYKPTLVVNNSTVPPGTTLKVAAQIGCPIVHSPSRGVHITAEHMVWEMKRWPKYVGGATPKASALAKAHFEKLGLTVKVLKGCTETELAKVFETTYRAWMITCFQEMHRISRKYGADFNDALDFLEDTHRQRLDRPIMFPGYIGGHCLIPNTELLLKSYDSDMLRLILESNQKRKDEMQNPQIKAEAEAVAKRADKLERELAGEENVTLPQSRRGRDACT